MSQVVGLVLERVELGRVVVTQVDSVRPVAVAIEQLRLADLVDERIGDGEEVAQIVGNQAALLLNGRSEALFGERHLGLEVGPAEWREIEAGLQVAHVEAVVLLDELDCVAHELELDLHLLLFGEELVEHSHDLHEGVRVALLARYLLDVGLDGAQERVQLAQRRLHLLDEEARELPDDLVDERHECVDHWLLAHANPLDVAIKLERFYLILSVLCPNQTHMNKR